MQYQDIHLKNWNLQIFLTDNFAVLFIDMRGSTTRAKRIGDKNTFLSMHAFIPAMLGVIREYDGYVIDIMGDGIMVFFGGKDSGIARTIAVKNAGMCGEGMLQVKEAVTNKLLLGDGIEAITCGVGIDYGNVIVTKIGISQIFDVKAFGDCINKASKYSNETDIIRVSKAVHDLWPKGKNGKMCFKGNDDNGYIVSRG